MCMLTEKFTNPIRVQFIRIRFGLFWFWKKFLEKIWKILLLLISTRADDQMTSRIWIHFHYPLWIRFFLVFGVLILAYFCIRWLQVNYKNSRFLEKWNYVKMCGRQRMDSLQPPSSWKEKKSKTNTSTSLIVCTPLDELRVRVSRRLIDSQPTITDHSSLRYLTYRTIVLLIVCFLICRRNVSPDDDF